MRRVVRAALLAVAVSACASTADHEAGDQAATTSASTPVASPTTTAAAAMAIPPGIVAAMWSRMASRRSWCCASSPTGLRAQRLPDKAGLGGTHCTGASALVQSV
jgi:hypothetical protein